MQGSHHFHEKIWRVHCEFNLGQLQSTQPWQATLQIGQQGVTMCRSLLIAPNHSSLLRFKPCCLSPAPCLSTCFSMYCKTTLWASTENLASCSPERHTQWRHE